MLDSIFEVIFLIGLIAGSVIRAVYARRAKPLTSGQKRGADKRTAGLESLLLFLSFLGMLVIPLVYVFTPWLDWVDYHLPTWAGWVGGAVFAAALWLLWRSQADLGRSWTGMLGVKDKHVLVTQGVYQRIRHPMYAAHLLWGIAQTLLLQNWIAGWGFLVSQILLCLYRVPREEQMMLEEFADEYRSYMSRTGQIIPRLWR